MSADPFVLTNDILELNVYCVNDEQVSINRLHYIATSINGSGGTLSGFLSTVNAALKPNYLPVLSSLSQYVGMSARIIYPLNHKTYYLWLKSKAMGSGGAILMPRQTCGMFTKQSGLSGPSKRGRVYVPFPSTADQQGGIDSPNAGYMVNLGSLAGAMSGPQFWSITVGNNTSASPLIYHRSLPTSSVIWGNATAKHKWATHRSRGDYGRSNVIPDALI